MSLEVGLATLMLIVFVSGLFSSGTARRCAGMIAAAGLLVLIAASFLLPPAGPGAGGAFVDDGLARFAKRLFLVSTFIGVLASRTAAAWSAAGSVGAPSTASPACRWWPSPSPCG